VELTEDDVIRRGVIQALMCRTQLDFAAMDRTYGIRFEDYFAAELEALQPLLADGLIRMGNRSVELTPVGRLLMRNVAMCFDAYLPGHQQSAVPRFSRAV
jgi:oxygen-independent coproporphyrinogen III oxidase